MRAVIVGRESLDALEALATSAFGPVPRRGLQPPTFSPESTPLEGLLMRAVPERSGHTLELQWRVESELQHYDAAPCQYFSHLLGWVMRAGRCGMCLRVVHVDMGRRVPGVAQGARCDVETPPQVHGWA